MGDIFEGLAAPDEDELQEFDTIARYSPELAGAGGALRFHNQARLIIPRLVKEIRRLRVLVKLECEREQLRHEKRLRNYRSGEQWSEYDHGLEGLKAPRNGKRKPEDVH